MSIDNDVVKFQNLFLEATAAIEPEYFLLPVAGKSEPVHLERVYCYELYHQMRSIWHKYWSNEPKKYLLNGELDKNGNPTMPQEFLAKAKPDLVVHEPGNHENNLVVIEVKRITSEIPTNGAIERDLGKLTSFRKPAEKFKPYKAAYYLFFGNHPKQIDKIRKKALGYKNVNIDLSLIQLFHHLAPGKKAFPLSWG